MTMADETEDTGEQGKDTGEDQDQGADKGQTEGQGGKDTGLPDERAGNTPIKDWRESITNPRLRDSAGKFTSLDALVESYNHLGGKLKKAIFLPEEKAPPEEVAKFRKALGVPEKPEGYLAAIKPPEGQEFDESDLAVMEEFAQIALENNVPAKAFASFMTKLTERATGLRESVAEQIEEAREAAEEELSKEWGNDFDKNVSLATRAAKGHGGDRFVKFLNSTKVEGFGLLGDHPEMVRFLANIGSKSDEHDMILQSTAQERQTAQAELDEIYEKYPPGTDGYKSQKVQKRIQELMTKIHGDKPIVGAAVR